MNVQLTKYNLGDVLEFKFDVKTSLNKSIWIITKIKYIQLRKDLAPYIIYNLRTNCVMHNFDTERYGIDMEEFNLIECFIKL